MDTALNMVKIDHKVKELINAYAKWLKQKKAHLDNKVNEVPPQVSVASLDKKLPRWKKSHSHYQALLHSVKMWYIVLSLIQKSVYVDAYSRRPRDYINGN